MSTVGYTIFGRPVQHEYVSNGLFNEIGLNSETYLSDHIELKKGQTLAILKRYKDNNGIEITTIFLNTFAESFNERPGGFVGAGLAFIGKPSTKLIYNRLKQLHQQCLMLVDSNNYKFKISKLNSDQIKLPDLSEEGLFVSKIPKNYTAKESIIGISFSGSFYENLMSAIQGFCFNESYFGVKTAYVTNSEDLLKSIKPIKSTYQIHNLLDYSYVFKKYSKLIADRKKKVEEEIKVDKQKFNEQKVGKENKLKEREQKIEDYEEKLNDREQSIRKLEVNKKNLENEAISLSNKVNDLEKEINNLNKSIYSLKAKKTSLEKTINDYKKKTFHEALNYEAFKNEKMAYEENIKWKYKEEQERNRKTDWYKVLFALLSVLFLISTIVLSYYRFIERPEKTNTATENPDNIESENTPTNLIISFPSALKANEFLDKDNEEREEHIKEIDAAITLLNDDTYKAFVSNSDVLSNRAWNFREVLKENVADDRNKGLDRLEKIMSLPFIKNTTLFKEPRFLFSQIDTNDNRLSELEIVVNADNKKDILKYYTEINNNIYNSLGIKYNAPEDNQTFQDTDPVLLMHFRWMIYNFNDSKKDINDLKIGDNVKVPVIK
jgi:hypothetical protein